MSEGYDMTYAEPNITNYVDMFQYANTVTNDMFGVGTIFTFVIITFLATSHFPLQKSAMYASFVGYVMSVLFLIMGLVQEQIAYILLIVMALPALITTVRGMRSD